MSPEADLDFLLLGPVEVRNARISLPLGGRLQRALLADLAVNAGRVVSTAQLIDDLWADDPPPSADHTVETYVSRLRRVLRSASVADILLTRTPGYVLDIEPDRLDTVRFARLVSASDDAAARGEVAESSKRLAEALALWRGAPLADVSDVPYAVGAAQRLEAQRLLALEKRLDADLRMGRHREIVPELETLTAAHPYREAFHGQLVLALYRSGQQADALAAHQKARRQLREDLGIDPGPELTRLEQAILNQDQAIALNPVARPALAAERARDPEPAPPRTGRQRRRRRLWPAIIAAACAAGAAVTVPLALGHQPPSGQVPANGVGLLSSSGRSVVVGLGTDTAPTELTTGAGSVWATSSDGNVVYRIDARAHHVTQQIPVGASPEGIAFVNGDVWVANVLDGTVSRINAATGRSVQTIGLGSAPTRVAFGYGDLWVTDPLASTVSAIDPSSGHLVKSISTTKSPLGIAVGGGSLWVTNPSDNTVTEIDPVKGSTRQRITVGAKPDAIAYGFGSVWVANRLDSTVSRIDPVLHAVDATIAVGEAPAGVTIGPSGVWVTASLSGSVERIDPGKNRAASTVTVGNHPTSAVFADGRLWVGVRPAPTPLHRGGTLHLLSSAPFGSIDPALGYPEVPPNFYAPMYDTLVTVQRESGSAGRDLVADLALAIPTPLDGGKTYTFTLRPGLRYSTGASVRPKDFRYGIERVMRASPAARSFFLGVVGADACTRSRCDLSNGIVTDDSANMVTFHLAAQDTNFLYKLAFAFAGPVPDSVPVTDPGTVPVPSTGPYMISRFVPGKEVDIVRNPVFHEWSQAAQPDGYPDAMVWTFGASPADELAAIEAGRADWLADTVPDVAAVEARYPTQVHVNPLPGIAYAAFNVTTPPFNDLRVRQAVSFAADRTRAVQVMGGPDAAQPTCQILPPSLPGYQRYCPFTVDPGRGSWIGPDLQKARRLIAASGTHGMSVVVWAHYGDQALGKYFVSVLGSLGYRATLRLATDADFAIVNDSRRHVQAAVAEWIADYPSASDFFDLFLRCSASTPGNPSATRSSDFYCRPEIDQLMDRAGALQATDPSAAADVWTQVDHAVTSDAPWVPFVSLRSADVVSARSGHYEDNPLFGLLLDQLWVR
jgi:YVTN family beta-propeller protein